MNTREYLERLDREIMDAEAADVIVADVAAGRYPPLTRTDGIRDPSLLPRGWKAVRLYRPGVYRSLEVFPQHTRQALRRLIAKQNAQDKWQRDLRIASLMKRVELEIKRSAETPLYHHPYH